MAPYPAELKDLQTVVLDLEELRRLLRAAERPGVRSVLSRAIARLESKIISDCSTATESDEEEEEEAYQDQEDEDVNLAETSSMRKRKGRGQPENSMMTKKLKLSATKKPPVVNGSSCESVEEQQTENSEQVLPENVDISEVNEASHMTLFSTKNSDDISNKKCKMKKSWCRLCEKPNHTESECCRLNGTCFNCHETGHIVKNCPKLPRGAKNASRMKIAGNSCESTQEKPVSGKKTSSGDVNDKSVLAIVATENISVSNETNQTVPSAAITVASELKNCANMPQYINSSCGNITVSAGTSCKSTQVEPKQESLPKVSEKTLSDKATSSNLSKVNADVSKGKPNLCTIIVEPTAIIQSSSQSKQEEQNQNQNQKPKTSRKRLWCYICQKSNHSELECCRRNGTCFTCHEAGHVKKNCPKAPREIVSISDDEEIILAPVENSDNSNGACLICHEMGHFTANCPKKKGSASTAKKIKWCGRCKMFNHVESECARLSGACLTCHETGHFTANCPKKIAQDVINYSAVKNISVTKVKVKGKVSSDDECFYCNQKGHWKRTCPKYLADISSDTVADRGS